MAHIEKWLRVTSIIDKGVNCLDMRVWKKTPTGGMPTKEAVVIDERMIIPLIIKLQAIHRDISSIEAK